MTMTDENKTAAPVDASRYRLLHTMLRVYDLEKSVDFYTRLLGMGILRKREVPEGKYTLVFVGYGEETETSVLELTYNWDQKEPYSLGSAYGHIAIGVPDIYGVCERLSAEGAKITRPPGPVKFGTTLIAFVEDPDGYKIELIQRS